jgi:hypothetical protein
MWSLYISLGILGLFIVIGSLIIVQQYKRDIIDEWTNT